MGDVATEPPERRLGTSRLRLMDRSALVLLEAGLRHAPGVELGFGIETLASAAALAGL